MPGLVYWKWPKPYYPPEHPFMYDENGKAKYSTPYDPRYPGTNKAAWCERSFYDYHNCRKIRGESYEPCNFFKIAYQDICPNDWVDRWEDQVRRKVFDGLTNKEERAELIQSLKHKAK